ncbi:hypothetical protein PHLCEN_2v13442 [Hermanssonia centrifuga]|uniref:Small ribosomal subunit protein mS29 n=1 Tax=Hermanssonia centrifuga TaxID=98765 RepID=A0A2R6NEG2_9APHY|nr:hypothetical protein PHLCEN_2v13442 [Hermanssonia centrifuga]
MFLPLPANQLKAPIFQTDQRKVLELPTFRPEALRDPTVVGKALQFPKSENDILLAYGVPKSLVIEFRLLPKPYTVVRDVTLTILDQVSVARTKSSKNNRAVLSMSISYKLPIPILTKVSAGPAGCGKSVLLLQAVEHFVAKKWIVLYIPRALTLVNSSSHYIYDPRTRTYLQPDFSYELLRRFQQINKAALEKLKTTKAFVSDTAPVRVGAPLTRLIDVGIENKSLAPVALSALFEELSQQTEHPVLLAVDDFQALYRHTTLYRDPLFHGIKPYHMSLPRLLLEYASGKKVFQRGAVLGALSTAHTIFQLPLELREALGIPYDRPSGPYVRRKPEMVEYAKGLKNIPVPAQMQIDEAASLYEVWGQSHWLRTAPNDEGFLATYTQAAGNPREFVWKGLLQSYAL